MIEFYKYHGAGNDFILIDDRVRTFDASNASLVNKLCDRHFGIGADGLMLLQNDEDSDFKMVYYNADGNLSTMCGNGGRCIVRFAEMLGIVNEQAVFNAIDGLHRATILSEETVRLEMGDVHSITQLDDHAYLLDTGSPHYVLPVSDLDTMDVRTAGYAIRNSDRFEAEGVNVNFIEQRGDGIAIRTYERGVEDETLACGTGVTAAAIASHVMGWGSNEVNVQAVGGVLRVTFDVEGERFTNIWKEGPTAFVFKGVYP